MWLGYCRNGDACRNVHDPSRIALPTLFDAAFPYLRAPERFDVLFRFAVAIGSPGLRLAG